MGDVLAQAPPEAKADGVEEEDSDEKEGGNGAGGIKYVGVLIRFGWWYTGWICTS